MTNIIIFGANSDIAKTLLKKLVDLKNLNFYLFSRNTKEITKAFNKSNIKIYDYNIRLIKKILHNLDDIDQKNNNKVIFFQGYFKSGIVTLDEVNKLFSVNCFSIFEIMYNIQKQFDIGKSEYYIITSAGISNLRKNIYFYSLSKLTMSYLIQGLRFIFKNIMITEIVLGPVMTKMTKNSKSNFLFIDKISASNSILKILFSKKVNKVFIPKKIKYFYYLLKIVPNFFIKNF